MKIVFMGTPDFSAVVLEKLNSVYAVSAVVTGLDKVSGRGQKLIPCALKNKAIELGIPVLQFDKVSKTGIEDIKALNPDLIITAAFGQILSDEFLQIAPLGVLNVHASLLPKYRGSSPIQQSIIDGETETGVTIMKTVKEVDAGDVLLQKSTPIVNKETAGELFDRLSLLGGEAIVDAIGLLSSGNAVFIPQDNTNVSKCKMFKREDGKIDFSKTFEEIDCFVRGMNPWPSAFTFINGKMLKIWEVEKAFFDNDNNDIENTDGNKSTYGKILAANPKDGLIVSCKRGAIKLVKVQAENSKTMTSEEFLRGHSVALGTIFDDNTKNKEE
ncbi:MAG: methionyl-tRNA formyltransferase [Clostridia bacterium]|nr:methionyl-tRNA formyltransferase [Clostridia bacterium]